MDITKINIGWWVKCDQGIFVIAENKSLVSIFTGQIFQFEDITNPEYTNAQEVMW